jgi:hypothetical protein
MPTSTFIVRLRLFARRGLIPPEAAAEMRQWEHGVASLSIPWSASRPRTGRGWSACYGIVPARSLRASGGSGRSGRTPGTGTGPAMPRRGCSVCSISSPSPQGQTVLSLTPMEFFERLATLIPPPRRHSHRYHGVLAPNAPLRAAVTSHAGLPMRDQRRGRAGLPQHPPKQQQRNHAPRQPLWARLLARIYEVFPLRCPRCGEPMQTDRQRHRTSPRPPGVLPGRRTKAIRSPLSEPLPEYEFDQRVSW